MDIDEIIEYGNQIEIKKNLIECITRINFDKKEYWDEITEVIEEIKENRLKEQQLIEKQHDTLTTLYNKEYTKKNIEEFLETQGSEENIHALMLIDIVNFGAINKSLGYMFGDNVLINLAERLKDIFYHSDIVGRIGGDEFVIFLKDVPSRDLLVEKARDIYKIFYNTYTGEDKSYQMYCTSGIAVYPTDGTSFHELFNAAHHALLDIRKTKTGDMRFYGDMKSTISLQEEDNYSEYQITKTKVFGTKNFDNEMIAFAFDIMSRTNDTKSAINLLLCKVREQFKCSKVSIIERIILGSQYHITYTCTTNGIGSIVEHRDSILAAELEEYMNCFDDNGVISISNLNYTQLVSLKKTLIESSTRAVLQCGIFDNKELTAVVNVEDDKERVWLSSEIESIITITKIISSYLLKLRTSDAAAKQLHLMKNYDSLTNLPTIHRFKNEVEKIIESNLENSYGIVSLDINKFRHMNEMLGFTVGDTILCDFTKYLTENFTYESIGRVAEDNFVMLVRFEDVDSVQKQFLKVCEEFSTIHKQLYPSTKFIITSGICRLIELEEITITIDNANLARRSYKLISSSTCIIYDEEMKIKVLKELDIVANMERALKEKEFHVFIQPKISLEDDTVVGGEALVRWITSDGTIIPPNDFIPTFEKNGFIIQLDFYIYEEVLKRMKQWMEQGIELVPISLNVSRIHLYDITFVDAIKRLVDRYDIPYSYIELELTESIFLKNLDSALEAMRGLRELGMKVSIDDFGAGYSSLNLLKNMDTDVIKLDKEFFSKGDEMQKEEKIIVSSIISMAKQLNLQVLSEGVETLNQSQFLKSVKCDMAQGYLYAKPMPFETFENIVQKRKIVVRDENLDYVI